MDGKAFFNPREKIEKEEKRKLQHWVQEGKLYFVTFRLADSIPKEAIKQIVETLNLFEREINYNEKILLHKEMEKYLNKGYGECLLKEKKYREIVEQSIEYYNNRKYRIDSFVIMPNHIHIILQMIEGNELIDIIKNLKHFITHQINSVRGKKDKIFQKGFYDRIIRDPYELNALRLYIKENPKKLREDMYSYYEDWIK
ncbi:MAG: transposase [Prevotella sp.]|jgi:REP element-mobilizing transposase RayT